MGCLVITSYHLGCTYNASVFNNVISKNFHFFFFELHRAINRGSQSSGIIGGIIGGFSFSSGKKEVVTSATTCYIGYIACGCTGRNLFFS
jgi:hypothetical protein